MKPPFIQITRHLYEEPHHLNLVILASNGLASGGMEFYLNTVQVKELGRALSDFPTHDKANHLFELGSERPEDNFGHYLRLRTFANNSRILCSIQLRLNNNEPPNSGKNLVQPQLTDFVIETNSESIKNLGKLLVNFSKLKHQRLFWSPKEGFIDNELQFSERRSGTDENIAAALASLPS